jgi:hypothetical protein
MIKQIQKETKKILKLVDNQWLHNQGTKKSLKKQIQISFEKN